MHAQNYRHTNTVNSQESALSIKLRRQRKRPCTHHKGIWWKWR